MNLTKMTIISTTVGKNPLEEMEQPSQSTRVQNAVLGCNLKNDRINSVHFQGKPLQYSCLENTNNSMKRQKDSTLRDELARWGGAQYATGEQWRNNSRKNEQMEPKQKQHPVVDVTGDGSKVQCCKEEYCIC